MRSVDLALHHKYEWFLAVRKTMDAFYNEEMQNYDVEAAAKKHGEPAIDSMAVITNAARTGTQFIVEKHFAELVFSAAATCPDDMRVTYDMVYTPMGWAEFEIPFNVSVSNEQISVQIIAWYADEKKIMLAYLPKTPSMQSDVVSAVILLDRPGTDREDAKLFFSLMYLMGTRLAVTRTERSTKPHVVKLATKSKVMSDISVVVLRRTYTKGESQGGRFTKEHDFQWTVAPHWRKQPYKSTGEVRPILIQSYVKGPPEKPLRMRHNIFIARR